MTKNRESKSEPGRRDGDNETGRKVEAAAAAGIAWPRDQRATESEQYCQKEIGSKLPSGK